MDLRDLFYATRSGAGGRAFQRFAELRRRWRQRVLRVPRRVAIACAVLLIAGEFIDRHLLSWGLGVALGAVEALWVWVSDSPPPHIENWRTGGEGEKRTANALAPLRRPGWILLHDLPDDRLDGRPGNLDHIAIGPSGVYMLDSKWLGGIASVDGDVVRVQRKDDPEDSYLMDRLAGSVRGKAVAVKREIAQTGVPWVQGLVVFWNDFEGGVLDAGNPIYVPGERLREWLLSRPHVLDQDQVHRIARAVQQARPPAESLTRRRFRRLPLQTSG
jgi:hypothetical protein